MQLTLELLEQIASICEDHRDATGIDIAVVLRDRLALAATRDWRGRACLLDDEVRYLDHLINRYLEQYPDHNIREIALKEVDLNESVNGGAE